MVRPSNVSQSIWDSANERERASIIEHERMHRMQQLPRGVTMDWYDFTSRHDMQQLAKRIFSMPRHQFNAMAPAVMAVGLMETNFVIRWAVKFIRWRHKVPARVAWAILHREMLKRDVDIFDKLQEAMATHMLMGKDKHKHHAASAGGFCEEEIAVIVELVNLAEMA